MKKIPIDSTVAEFWKVAVIPDPAPRLSGGRLFMIAARFGALNSPWPTPASSRISANCQ